MTEVLFRNARIETPIDTGGPSAGARQAAVDRWPGGALLCRDGRIVAVGEEAGVRRAAAGAPEEIDCGGRCLIPGLVDPHTHLCFTRAREEEFRRRLDGADYLEILRSGGGILASVAAVHAASEDDLGAATRARALSALSLGTTTIEIKTGYGLSRDAEMKQLRVIGSVGRETPLRVVPTFLAAHAVPADFAGRADAYVDSVIGMLPAAVAGEKEIM